MPGGVIEVRRRERAGWLERIHLFSALRSLRVMRRRRRATRLAGSHASGPSRLASLAISAHEASLRGMPVLVADQTGAPRCVACGLCEFACPPRCLSVVPGDHPEDPFLRSPERFDLDLGRCIFCGLCEAACPEEAIVMSPVLAPAVIDRASLVFDRDALLVEATRLEDRIAFLGSTQVCVEGGVPAGSRAAE